MEYFCKRIYLFLFELSLVYRRCHPPELWLLAHQSQVRILKTSKPTLQWLPKSKTKTWCWTPCCCYWGNMFFEVWPYDLGPRCTLHNIFITSVLVSDKVYRCRRRRCSLFIVHVLIRRKVARFREIIALCLCYHLFTIWTTSRKKRRMATLFTRFLCNRTANTASLLRKNSHIDIVFQCILNNVF